MSTPRRVYIYLVSGISLQAVIWALISLLRNLLLSRLQPDRIAIAFQIAVIIIGLPVFLGHWLWGQRLAREDPGERDAGFRKLYLYGMQAIFLIPIIDSLLAAVGNLLALATGETARLADRGLTGAETIIFYLLAVLVLAPFWYYQRMIIERDADRPDVGTAAAVRRTYVLLFSMVGLVMTAAASISLLQWIMFQIRPGAELAVGTNSRLFYELSRLAIGLPVWLIFWRWAQRLFTGSNQEERASSLRKVYLYLTVLAATLISVTSAAFILNGLFRRLLSVASTGAGGDIHVPLSLMIGMAAVWAYHAQILKHDAEALEEAPAQARIRRIYSYLIGAIGLSAFIAGVAGITSALIQSMDASAFGTGMKSLLAGSAAALLAGLPVWLLPWRTSQNEAEKPAEEGAAERRSVARRIYLYFFMLVATLTVLSNVVFIVFRILSAVLGEDPPSLTELGQAIAYSGIAIGVWLYHGYVLREDGKRLQQDQVARLEGLQVAIIDPGDDGVGQLIMDAIGSKLPGLSAVQLKLEGSDKKQDDFVAQLKASSVIIGPWSIKTPGGRVSSEVAAAIEAAPARKLLYPTWTDKWDWIGVDRANTDDITRQTTAAVEQILKDEKVKPARPLSVGAIIGIIIAVLVLLLLLSVSIVSFLLLSSF